MNMNIPKRFTGYLLYCRNMALIFRDQPSKVTLWGLYSFFTMQADWDSRHDTYGNLPTNSQLSKILLLSQPTISRGKSKLEAMGLIETVNRVSRIKHINFFKSSFANELSKKTFSNSKEVIQYMNEIDSKLNDFNAYVKENKHENDDPFSFPFKSDLSSSDSNSLDLDEIDRGIKKIEAQRAKVLE